MALMRRRSDFYPSFPSIVNDFLRGDVFNWLNQDFTSTDSTLPAMNVKESDDNYTIEVAAPGLKKEDFKIQLDRGILTISSEKKEEKEDSDKSYSRMEFRYESFQRSFSVPEDLVEGDKIEAKYKEGILFVTLPKKEESKKRTSKPKEIAIS